MWSSDELLHIQKDFPTLKNSVFPHMISHEYGFVLDAGVGLFLPLDSLHGRHGPDAAARLGVFRVRHVPVSILVVLLQDAVHHH